MMRRLAATGAAIGLLLVAANADAQVRGKDFGDKGSFIFSADRLVPLLSFTRLSQDDPNPPANTKITNTTTQTGISILWGSTDNPQSSPAQLFFTVPRVGFDYVFAPSWTIGGEAVIFFTLGGSSSTETQPNNGTSSTVSVSSPSTVLFGIAPRVGYVFDLSNVVSLWLRGGPSFYTASTKATNGNDSLTSHTNQFALDFDPQLVIIPVQHFAFTAGLTADIPIVGNVSVDSTTGNVTRSASASSSMMFVGATAGLLGWF